LEVVGLLDLVSIAPLRDASSVLDLRRAETSVDRIAVLTDAWRTACETHPDMSHPVVFRDPESIISETLRVLDSESRSLEPWAVSHTLPETLSQDAPVARLAVLQLLELRRVGHAWIEWSAFPRSRHRELQRRLTEVLDAFLIEVVSAALTELERAALVDPLTGLMNRRALDRDLTQFLAAARRHGRALTVVMLDVVGLKAVNDRFGHEAGDDMLQDVAAGLVNTLRVGDNVYRIGGDEFVLLLPDLRPEDVDAVMDRTVVSAGGAFTWGSAGVPTDLDSGAVTPASLLLLADHRMIEHRGGRQGVAPEATSAPVASKKSRFAGDSARLVGQLQAAERVRSVIEQAKGIVAEHFGVDVEDALTILNASATSSGKSVRRLAMGLVDRTITAAELAGHRVADGHSPGDEVSSARIDADADGQ
jgi:GGDEF domain-containing protein